MTTLSLSGLPAELLENILGFVERPKELLSLALSCRLLCGLIIPHHLDYRIIETHAGNFTVWQSLISNQLLAANVHTLHISAKFRRAFQQQNSTTKLGLVPRSMLASSLGSEWLGISLASDDSGDQEEAVKIIKEALRRLYNLTTLIWEPDSRLSRAWALYPCFSTCLPNLRSITVDGVYRRHVETPSVSLPTPYIDLFAFSNLTEISFKIRHAGTAFYANELENMLLERSPKLQKLQLSVLPERGVVNFMRTLRSGYWPNIHSLTLIGSFRLYADGTEDDERANLLRDFLLRNKTLQCLNFGSERMISPGFMPVGGLPRLKSLGIGHRFRDRFVNISEWFAAGSVSNLECFHSSNLLTPRCIPFLSGMTSLRYLSIVSSFEDFVSIVRSVPSVERLHIELVDDCSIDWSTFVEHVSQLKHLRILTGSYIFLRCEEVFFKELVQRLGKTPKLRYCRFISDAVEAVWIEYERDEHGKYSGHSQLAHNPLEGEGNVFALFTGGL